LDYPHSNIKPTQEVNWGKTKRHNCEGQVMVKNWQKQGWPEPISTSLQNKGEIHMGKPWEGMGIRKKTRRQVD